MDSSETRLHIRRDRPKKANFIKVRFIIAVLTTLCPVVCYISRQNLPFAIVSMMEDSEQQRLQHQQSHSAAPKSLRPLDYGAREMNVSLNPEELVEKATDSDDDLDTCPEPNKLGQNGEGAASAKGYGPKYPWSTEDKGILLGAFFWTYVLCQIPGARLAERIGVKWILATATIGSGLLSLLSPWAASVHVHLLSLIRLLMGVCQAALYPACYVLYAEWLPPIERSQALPVLCVGAYVGSIITSSLTGYFSEQPNLGWEYSFYTPGVICALWTLAWILFASNRPREHPTISIEELAYIESKMEVLRYNQMEAGETELRSGAGSGGASGSFSSRPQIGWLKLFRSRSIWAMMVAFFASNWSFNVVLLLMPTYLNKILHVTPLKSGFINSIIYVLYCISSPLVGSGSTMMVETRSCGLSRLNIRKLFQGVALFGPALCFVALPLLGCEQSYVFAALYIQIILYSFVNGGEVQLPTELSADFAGTIYAIGNCVGSSTGFIAPAVFSKVVWDENSRAQWDLFFYLGAVISVVGGLVFVTFGQNHLQDFSKDLSSSEDDICKLTHDSGKGSSFNLEQAIVSSKQSKNRHDPRRRGSYGADMPRES